MRGTLAALTLSLTGLSLAASLPPLNFAALPASALTLSDGRTVIPAYAGSDLTLEVIRPAGTRLDLLPPLSLDPLPAGARRLSDGRYVISHYAGSEVTVILLSPRPLRAPAEGGAAGAGEGRAPSADPDFRSPLPDAPLLPLRTFAPLPAAPRSDPAFQGRAQATPTPARTFAPLPPPAPEVGPAASDPAFRVKVDPPRLAEPSFAALPARVTETPAPRPAPQLTLPPDLKGNFIPRLVNGDLQVTYSLVNTSRATVYRLALADLSLQQGGRPAAGRLERRNSSAEPGLLPPDSGEYGSVTVTTLDAAPITLSWLVTDETHKVSYPLRLTWWPGDLKGEARDAQ